MMCKRISAPVLRQAEGAGDARQRLRLAAKQSRLLVELRSRELQEGRVEIELAGLHAGDGAGLNGGGDLRRPFWALGGEDWLGPCIQAAGGRRLRPALP